MNELNEMGSGKQNRQWSLIVGTGMRKLSSWSSALAFKGGHSPAPLILSGWEIFRY